MAVGVRFFKCVTVTHIESTLLRIVNTKVTNPISKPRWKICLTIWEFAVVLLAISTVEGALGSIMHFDVVAYAVAYIFWYSHIAVWMPPPKVQTVSSIVSAFYGVVFTLLITNSISNLLWIVNKALRILLVELITITSIISTFWRIIVAPVACTVADENRIFGFAVRIFRVEVYAVTAVEIITGSILFAEVVTDIVSK